MLVDDIRAVLPDLQAEAEGRMVDTCTLAHPGGEETFDPDTGTYTTPAATTYYSGPCEVQISDGLTARETEAGGTELTLSRLTLKVPVSVEGIEVNDIATITASELDPALVDQEYRVLSGFAKTFATARRLQVEAVSA